MYDYIIVGAGSAGCVLARRLSDDSACRVLLVEAGGKDWNPFIHMPAGVGELLKRRWTNWYFHTDQEPHLNNRRLYWPRGKTLGGSSAMNGMIYIRGHRNDYDRWGALPGCEGWDYASVLPWFKRSEHFVQGANDYHGDQGEMGVSPPSSDMELFDTFLAAGGQAGWAANEDFNGAQQEGVGRYHVTIRDGVRQSASRCFLTPEVRKRPNLEILTQAHVTRLLLDNGRATGIELLKGGESRRITCGNEVLLCAGSVQSPQILLLSGIGPEATLAEHDIEPLHVLAGVGENLQDHLDVSVQYHCLQPVTLYDQIKPHRSIATLLRYLATHRGPGASNGLEAGAFLRTPLADAEPDVQLHFIPSFMIDHAREPAPGHGFMLHACGLRPKSRGRISLWSSDPQESPRIQAGYLSEEADLKVLVEAVKLSREVFGQNAFDRYRGEEYMPGKTVRTDAEIEDFIRQGAETIYHPVGTCRMGAADDAMSVVDGQCRVHGLEGLRVVDASVIPQLIGGNTNAPTIMVAERIADRIKAA